MARAVVAVVRTRPETGLEDTVRAFELGNGPTSLQQSAGTILQDNISWHYPFPSANTTPWQLEGTVLALRRHGYADLCCVQNKTEVTNAFKGERLNLYRGIFATHGVEVRYNFRESDMKWVVHRPRTKLLVLNE